MRTRGETVGSLRAIAVTSGKGGVGKSNVAANLAVALAHRGQRVCVLDADVGLANLDVLYGLEPREGVQHVLRGERTLADVMVEGPAGVRLIPGASGLAELTALSASQQLCLLDAVDALEGTLDVLLVDTAAGVSSNVLFFAGAAAEVLVVITPEPTSIADAYAVVKLLAARHGQRLFQVVVNMAAGVADAHAAFQRLARVAQRFLRVQLVYRGYIPFDDAVPRAVRTRRPFTIAAPGTPAAEAIAGLAAGLMASAPAGPSGGVQFFFRQLLEDGGR